MKLQNINLLFIILIFNFNLLSKFSYEELAQENLKTLVKNEHVFDNFESDSREYYQIYKDEYIRQCNLPSFIKRQTIFNLLTNKDRNRIENNPVTDKDTWQDLDLVSGSKSNPEIYLGSLIDRTNLEVGKVLLFKKLVHPLYDPKKLIARQELIKELIRNKELFNLCENTLSELKTAESVFLSLWQENDIFNNQLHYFTIKLPFCNVEKIKNLNNKLNKNKYFLELNDKINLGSTCIFSLMKITGAVLLPIIGISQILKNTEYAKIFDNLLKNSGSDEKLSKLTISGASIFLLKKIFGEKNNISTQNSEYLEINNIAGITSIITGLVLAQDAWSYRNGLRDHIAFKQVLHEKLRNCAQIFNAYKLLFNKLSENQKFLDNFPQVRKIKSKLYSYDNNIQQLNNYLSDNIFKHPANIYSNAGKVFATYKLLLNYKRYFFKILMDLGEIDSLLSIAKLYILSENTQTKFCFPEFIDSSNTNNSPFIELECFWNPLINSQNIICNSIKLGKDNTRNILITGPNTGGKSTIGTKGITLAILMAQSLTIAPAQSLKFTPFRKIITYLKINDDTLTGKSFFKTGVIRAAQILNTVKTLEEKQFALTSIDELFNGTNYLEGQAAAYSFLELLGAQKQVICISTTHFPILTNLEKNTKLFENYKVCVLDSPDQKIQYLYKLEKGISQQHIALKILQEEGYGDSFINKAKIIIDKYIDTYLDNKNFNI